jgi:NADP-dependent 3-hydroxy acid dehydrogenase YdfG
VAAGDARAVVVTGASTGIGAACALELDRLGFRVFAGVRRAADGAALQRRASPLLTTVALDVTEAASVAGAARTASPGSSTMPASPCPGRSNSSRSPTSAASSRSTWSGRSR